MTHILSTLLFIISFINPLTQSNEKLKPLFDKKWHITSFEISGHQVPTDENEKNDYIIFYSNSSLKKVEIGIITLAKWSYDDKLNTLTLSAENVADTTVMKILVLNDKEFIWETTNPEGIPLTINMVNVSE